MFSLLRSCSIYFFNDTATTEIYTLSLHDALPIYRIAKFSDKYLPFNLAMLFLVDEMYRNVGKKFRVVIGKPIPWQTFDKSKTPMEWANFVEEKVYEL